MVLKRTNPTKTKAWKKLQEHHKTMQSFNLKKAFQDSNRKNNFTFKENDFSIDFSKNLITKETLSLLINLAKETELKDRQAVYR